jgi:hypothetical protein
MKRTGRKFLSLALSLVCVLGLVSAPSVLAEEETVYPDDFVIAEGGVGHGLYDLNSDGIQPLSDSLLRDTMLTFYHVKDTFEFVLSCHTITTKPVNKVGFKELKCERLVDGVWTTYIISKDLYNENTDTYRDSRRFAVMPEYYYRIAATHYAEITTLWIFKDSQERVNVTDAIYMPG